MAATQQSGQVHRWEVFLSSTIRDLDSYRGGVKEVLERIRMACFPSEGWVNPHGGTEARCRKMFERSNSFVLLLGYWYGWVEQAGGKSITHKEFDWAIERWGQNRGQADPPMAVLIPAPESAAAVELRDRAKALVADPVNPIDALAHEARVQAFHADARDRGRTCMTYRDLHDLRETIIILTREWSGDTPMAATRSAQRDGDLVDDDARVALADIEFGDLGRKPQFDAVEEARAVAADEAGTPALALLAYGDANAGQGCFLERLLVRELKRPARCRGSLMPSCSDVSALCEKVAQLLGLELAGINTAQRLAELAAEALRHHALAFVLDRAAAFPGGAAAIEAQFWTPFYLRLADLHRAQPLRHRLVAVIGDFSGAEPGWLTSRPESDPPRRSELLALPRLQPLTRLQLRKWLTRLDVAQDRHSDIVDRVMTGEDGADDPAPLRVIDRLRREYLQTDEDDE